MALLQDLSTDALDKADVAKQIASMQRQLNDWARILSNEDKTKIVKSDSGVEALTTGQLPGGGNGILIKDQNSINKALFGEFPDHSISLKIAEDGTDVTTATDDQLIFNSAQNIFKIVDSGNVNVTNSTISAYSKQTITIAHNLGFIPAFLCYVTMPNNIPSNTIGGGLYPLPALSSIADSSGFGTVYVWVTARIDNTNLYLDINAPNSGGLSSGYVFSFRYYILQETAA